MITNYGGILLKGGSKTGTPGTRPPVLKYFGFVFIIFFTAKHAYSLIGVNMQCAQYVFYSLL